MNDDTRQTIMNLIEAAYREGHKAGGFEGFPDSDWLESDAHANANELLLLDNRYGIT